MNLIELEKGKFLKSFNGLCNAHDKTMTLEKKNWWYEQVKDFDERVVVKAFARLRSEDRFPNYKTIMIRLNECSNIVRTGHDPENTCHEYCLNGVVIALACCPKANALREIAFRCEICSGHKEGMASFDPRNLIFDERDYTLKTLNAFERYEGREKLHQVVANPKQTIVQVFGEEDKDKERERQENKDRIDKQRERERFPYKDSDEVPF